MQPATDMELLIRFEGKLDNLTEAIERLGDGLKSLEEKKISIIEKDIVDLKTWRAQMVGAFRLFMIAWPIGTAIIVALIKWWFKWG